MSEYWLISLPSERNADESWKILQTSVNKVKNCSVYKFYIPTLKVGTLDSLLSNADNIAKLEMYLEGLLNRLGSGLANTINEEKNNIQVNELLKIEGETMHIYMVTFKWDIAKFPTKQTILCITELAQKQAAQIENDYKLKYQEYVTVRNAYDNAMKNEQGSLMTRHLQDLVIPNDFVQNSIYLRTILVVIPKKLLNDWLHMYERFDETVIPRSSRIIAEDPDYYLIGVTLFKSKVHDFTEAAKRFKFIVRDHERDLKEDLRDKEKLITLQIQKKEMYEPLVKMLKHDFSEIFKNYIHIKATKLFIESVLRYGLPANFRAAIIVVNKKSIKKMRDTLHHLYRHLDVVTSSEGDKTIHLETLAAVGHNPADYYPYVTTKINTDFV